MYRPVLVLLALVISSAFPETADIPAGTSPELFLLRDGLQQSRMVFETTRQGRVAYLGGSITASPGWRDITYDLLKERFPDTTFDFINAGVGGTNSTFGKGPVDLLFLEFAVNDGADSTPGNRPLRAMEGIIRQARTLNPRMDICMLYFADTEKVETYKKGETPEIIQLHETVAEHYGIPVIYLAAEVTRRINAGALDWARFSRDSCHPTEEGHALYGKCIDLLLHAAWGSASSAEKTLITRPLPEPLDPLNYEHGRFVPLDQAHIIEGWKRLPQWDTEKKCNYGGTVDVLAAEAPGAVLELTFEGTVIAVSAIAGMDAGSIDVSIDGGTPTHRDFFDSYCTQFHRPVFHVLAEDMAPGEHSLRITVTGDSNPQSTGHAVRIQKFAVN